MVIVNVDTGEVMNMELRRRFGAIVGEDVLEHYETVRTGKPLNYTTGLHIVGMSTAEIQKMQEFYLRETALFKDEQDTIFTAGLTECEKDAFYDFGGAFVFNSFGGW